jgi:hypothetical protein
MKIDGQCHCGEIAYEANVDENSVRICHCTDCQSLGGSAFRTNVNTTAGGFKLLRGTPKRYIKTADSGNKRLQAFCGTCGTAIYASAVDNPQVYSLRMGTIKQRTMLKPREQIWRTSALTWVDSISALPGRDGQ